jgi:hypothetical protein
MRRRPGGARAKADEKEGRLCLQNVTRSSLAMAGGGITGEKAPTIRMEA